MDSNPSPNPPAASMPPRRYGRSIVLGVLVFAAGALAGGALVRRSPHPQLGALASPAKPAERKTLYQCPMHPTITADHPGECPICGMRLVPIGGSTAPSAKGGERKIAFYRSPMDPKQTAKTPRKDEMGMDYIPVFEDEVAGMSAPVSGLAVVTIEPARQQLIGLRTAKVTRGMVGGTWHTVARIEVSPSRVRKINVKVDGFVEKMYVDFVGQSVRRGQPLFSVYSPTLLAAQNEYLLALQTRDSLAKSGGLSENGAAMVAAGRRRLELWDVSAAELERLERTREPSKNLTVVSPIAGVVTAKNVVQGARVTPGEAPYEITDLGEVWVMADAYESDLARIRPGMTASLALSAYPNRTFTGKVAFIDPVLDPKTRTVKVHLHFMNPTRELKPEMFGEVTLAGVAREGLRIPADAVIRAGTRDVVFLAEGNGRFEPRVVKLGERSGDEVEVQGGLQSGQDVITRANFLVDSESQLRASLAAIGGR